MECSFLFFRRYDCQIEGEFILYKHTTLPFEVSDQNWENGTGISSETLLTFAITDKSFDGTGCRLSACQIMTS